MGVIVDVYFKNIWIFKKKNNTNWLGESSTTLKMLTDKVDSDTSTAFVM